MKTLTKRLLLSVLVVMSVVFGAVSMMMVSAKAENTEAATFQTAEFTMREGAAVRIGSDATGEKFDYTKNGIRFMAKMSISDYEDIEDDGITFGILIAPKDYHDVKPINEANVFGTNNVYDFVGGENKTRIVNMTTTELFLMDSDNDGVSDCYGYYASLVNLLSGNETREFVAVSYLAKSTTNSNTGDINTEYRFCDNNLSSRSMAYVAQLALEKNPNQKFATELKEQYIDGKETTVTFEYEKAYDGYVSTSNAKFDVKLPLGSTVSANDITEKLINEGLIDDTFALANASAIEGKKVYADGKTDVSILTYNAVEAESDDYNKLKGFYKTEDGSELLLTKDKTVEIDGAAAVDYKLYADGTVKTTVNGNTTFGSYDLVKGTFNIKVGSEVLDYAEVLELDSKAYTAVANTYEYNGVSIKLNANGTLIYNYDSAEEQNGVYVLCYDESTNKYYIVINAGSTVITEEIDVKTNVINGFTIPVKVSKEEYSKFAGYYNCTSTGDYLDLVFKFNTDGTVLVSGAEVGNFKLVEDGENLSVIATINGIEMTGAVTYNSTVYGYDSTIIELTSADSSSSLKLVRGDIIGLNPYDIFANSTTDSHYFGAVDSKGLNGKVVLHKTKTTISSLLNADGSTNYYELEFWFRGTSSYQVYYKTNTAYCLTPTSATGGTLTLKYNNNSYTSSYGIDEKGKLFITLSYLRGDVTAGSPWTFYLDDAYVPTTPASELSLMDTFASSEGTVYGNASSWSLGYVRLFNTLSTASFVGTNNTEWYKAQYGYHYPDSPAYSNMAYKLGELENGVGIITIKKDVNTAEKTIPYGITNGIRWIDMRSWSPNATSGGTTENNIKKVGDINSANLTPAITEQVANYAKVYENIGGGESAVVETFDIYKDIAGSYGYWNNYNGVYLGYDTTITLNADKTVTYNYASGTGTYTLSPITENYGSIIINHPGIAGFDNENGDDIFGYYSKIGEEYVIRMMWKAYGVKYWHFIDFAKTQSNSFSTYSVFKDLEGETYTGNGFSLELKNFVPASDKGIDLAGAKFVFTAGEETINGTYDFVATSLTAGKIFMDFSSNTDYYNPSDVDRYVIGDYVKVGDNYVISFTYKGVSYAVSKDASSFVTMISGDYKGANGTNFTIGANATVDAETVYTGKVTVGETTAKYVIEDNRIIVTYKDASDNDVIVIKAR